MKVQWRTIYGTEGNYSISNTGRVKSEPRKGSAGGIIKNRTMRPTKIMKINPNLEIKGSRGAPRVMIIHHGEHRNYTIRELMKCYWPEVYFSKNRMKGVACREDGK